MWAVSAGEELPSRGHSLSEGRGDRGQWTYGPEKDRGPELRPGAVTTGRLGSGLGGSRAGLAASGAGVGAAGCSSPGGREGGPVHSKDLESGPAVPL